MFVRKRSIHQSCEFLSVICNIKKKKFFTSVNFFLKQDIQRAKSEGKRYSQVFPIHSYRWGENIIKWKWNQTGKEWQQTTKLEATTWNWEMYSGKQQGHMGNWHGNKSINKHNEHMKPSNVIVWVWCIYKNKLKLLDDKWKVKLKSVNQPQVPAKKLQCSTGE